MTYRWVEVKNGKPFPLNYKREKLYDYHEIDELIGRLTKENYECVQVDEGILGSGNWICVAPDDKHYNFIINEVALNCWSSAHTIRRCKKLSKANANLLAELGY